jgi:predicted DNA binding CopG/RHH family protein
MAKRTLKPIPKFRSEAQERRFWETHDTSEFVDWSKARDASFPDLKPTTTTISLRLPSTLLSELKILANKQDVPYQSLLKVLLAESVARERRGGGKAAAATRLHRGGGRRRRRA